LGAARPAPLSWLVTTLLAPLSALLPWAVSGRVAGQLQAKLHPATDADRSQLVDSMLSFKAQVQNRFLHVLLVYAFAQAGTQVGAILGALLALKLAL
jgi:pheromone shutdown protein TraB